MSIQVEVVSAEELIFSGEADFVELPGEMGALGILPRHTPLITRIRAGAVCIKHKNQDEPEYIHVEGGILEVQPDRVTVLADTAIRAKDLDEQKVQDALKQAQEAKAKAPDAATAASLDNELAGLLAQLSSLRKLRKPGH